MRAVAVALASALVVVAGCVLFTGGTDDADKPKPDAGGGGACLAARDCDGGGVCCLTGTDIESVSFTCQASCMNAPPPLTFPVQLCVTKDECGDAGCLKQSCMLPDGGFLPPVQACGELPHCSVQ